MLAVCGSNMKFVCSEGRRAWSIDDIYVYIWHLWSLIDELYIIDARGSSSIRMTYWLVFKHCRSYDLNFFHCPDSERGAPSVRRQPAKSSSATGSLHGTDAQCLCGFISTLLQMHIVSPVWTWLTISTHLWGKGLRGYGNIYTTSFAAHAQINMKLNLVSPFG